MKVFSAINLLGLGLRFSTKDIELAYRRMVKTIHPDICAGPEATRLLRLATDARAILLKVKVVEEKPQKTKWSDYRESYTYTGSDSAVDDAVDSWQGWFRYFKI